MVEKDEEGQGGRVCKEGGTRWSLYTPLEFQHTYTTRKKSFFFFLDYQERCFSPAPKDPQPKKAEINNKFNEILNEAIFIGFSMDPPAGSAATSSY